MELNLKLRKMDHQFLASFHLAPINGNNIVNRRDNYKVGNLKHCLNAAHFSIFNLRKLLISACVGKHSASSQLVLESTQPRNAPEQLQLRVEPFGYAHVREAYFSDELQLQGLWHIHAPSNLGSRKKRLNNTTVAAKRIMARQMGLHGHKILIPTVPETEFE